MTSLTELAASLFDEIEANPAAVLGKCVLSHLRYEKLRTLNLNEVTKIHHRNLAGELFDDIVDEYVEGKHL